MTTATTQPHKIFLAGRWVDSPELLVIDNPARPGEPAGATYSATPEQYEEAAAAAVAAFEKTRRLPAFERSAALRHISAGIAARREEIGRLIAVESGKRLARPDRHRSPLPHRPDRGNQPLQLPAEPGGS
jgi:acyl-CoA reductase-like NAD-dependent aldehyde dehydrogenase